MAQTDDDVEQLQQMARAVQLSRLFKGVVRAAGVLALAQRRAAERIFAPGGDGCVEAAAACAKRERGDCSFEGDGGGDDCRGHDRTPCHYCTGEAAILGGTCDVDRSGEVPLRPLCRRCFTLYEPCVEWMKDCRRDGGFNYAHVDHAALEWVKEEIDEYMPRAVRLSRLFKGVARAAGRLVVLHRRAVERVYAPGGEGYVEAASEFAAAALRLRGSGRPSSRRGCAGACTATGCSSTRSR